MPYFRKRLKSFPPWKHNTVQLIFILSAVLIVFRILCFHPLWCIGFPTYYSYMFYDAGIVKAYQVLIRRKINQEKYWLDQIFHRTVLKFSVQDSLENKDSFVYFSRIKVASFEVMCSDSHLRACSFYKEDKKIFLNLREWIRVKNHFPINTSKKREKRIHHYTKSPTRAD